MEVARELAALGFPTTLVEKTPGLDGDHLPAGSSAAVEGLEIIRGATLASLSGSVGDFTAVLSRGSLTVTRRFGAIVIASGVSLRGSGREPFLPGTVIPLPDLDAHLAGLAKRDLPASIAILLDMEHDETIASAETAFRSCLSLRSRYQSDVTLLLRDARVSSLGLETLYDQAREAGVTVAKYGEKPSLRSSGPGVTVSFLDGVLGEEVEMSFGLVAVSPYGLPAPADRSLAEAAGITLDALAHMQENNVHLLPERSNRPGVFLVGSCRGEAHVPTILRDARNAALSVHSLLSLKSIEVELSHAVVDGDKCALCLTCVRSCPFKAMRVFAEEKRADCAPQACRRCGLCVGECPNRAITLPAYSEAIVLARAGA
jgi:heterodisulfide reductase subunit A-like polyferredoxin